jgi:hypothetical protein
VPRVAEVKCVKLPAQPADRVGEPAGRTGAEGSTAVAFALPKINDRVRIGLPDDILLPSRIEDVARDAFEVAAPSYVGDLELPEIGTELELLWTSERGLYRVATAFRGVRRRRIAVWELGVLGEVTVAQRRDFVRVPVPGMVSLVEEGSSHTAHLARLGDVSEGGLRCQSTSNLSLGRVSVRFEIGEDRLRIPGQVVRIDPADGPVRAMRDIIVAFDEDEKLRDQLRPALVREQLRQRRARRSADRVT